MQQQIAFGRVVISQTGSVVTVAEAACEHLGSLEVAKRMAEAAKGAGVDIIKFQLHLPEEMVPNSIRLGDKSLDEILAGVNLSVEAHRELISYCEEIGIQYLCTPFCARAADVLEELGVTAFKIGSGEMTNLPMLKHIARKGKPMIVSTGMASMDEIEKTVSVLTGERATVVLMHCTSVYPPRYEQVNLRVISRLKEAFGMIVGFSDHTPDLWTALGAIVVGAKVIEKHFTLDHALKGPDHHVSLEPQEFRTMVEAIRKLEAALGSEKTIHPEEHAVRRWAHHSVVTLREIPAGAIIAHEMVGVKRPGWGVPAERLEEFHGCVARRAIAANSLLSWDDVEAPAPQPVSRHR